MRVNCEGCAGCCIDWRPVAPETLDHERRGRRDPLDDTYNLVPLTRDEVKTFLDEGLADAMTPRLFRADGRTNSVTVDGYDLAAIDGGPVFYVGLRKPPKPVGPFGLDPTWLDTCIFLDPETLRCRIHGSELYPATCGDYPGQNLTLDRETECERVERSYGGERLLDDDPPEKLRGFALGPQALGAKLFVYPDPEELTGVVDRLADGETAAADRALFVGAAVGSRPGTTAVDGEKAERGRKRALEANSWAGAVIEAWTRRAGRPGDDAEVRADRSELEERRGAPPTEEW
ncbi:YkgJ family cysteine cluster protein [Haloprofundus salinisoli]|uniref:YkgJ family cysteine cluster protein n=1 Tax=Haloprofundus salinisoli TaxID=2876193 RepID=UPI001CC9987F|nr:YkgJ family cysteine cluster protein [Haloprofundus salinisoli]